LANAHLFHREGQFLLLALKESVRGLQFITVIATVERALSDMPVTVTFDMM